jgi:uncharacterized lipoprotein YddW (UPF0748 family)
MESPMTYPLKNIPRKNFAWSCPVLAMLILLLVTGCPPQGKDRFTTGLEPGEKEPPPPDLREVWPPQAIWVVRRVYDSPQEIADLMERIKNTGLNTVFFQVRGNGTVYYDSDIEPLDPAFENKPDFDQLTVACREAHRRGLALHAWVNVMPGWKGKQPPRDPDQLYNKHPEWFWYDHQGRRQPLGWYVSLNPCLPEVRRYLVRVFSEIAANYPIDGLHLDYIRFPSELMKNKDYPYDTRTLALFKKATGLRPADAPHRWTEWRVRQVTQLVRGISHMMKNTRPRALLTAAVGTDIKRHRHKYFQDGPAWLRNKLIDAAFTMDYTDDTHKFRRRQEAWREAVPNRHVAAGIGVHLHKDPRVTYNQLEFAEYWGSGFSLFSADHLFNNSFQSRQQLKAIRAKLLDQRHRPMAAAMKKTLSTP